MLRSPAAVLPRTATLALLSLAQLSLAPTVHGQQALEIDPDRFGALEWREVGPFRGGRAATATGIPSDRNTYYFGAAGGGVWKTGDGGLNWNNVSDGFFGGSIGSVTVASWDPNVVYVGTGESTVRGNVSHGDGAWRSSDAGKTWTHIGLEDSRHIPRIQVHPRNPDLVYAASLGHLFGPNEERGVYRSYDGGGSWQRVLHVNPHAGAIELAMDPTNPRVLYACFWRVLRTPWSLESGGEGSGIWKSTDSGDTWTEITRNQGLPQGTVGISGITVSPSNPENLYAIIEAEDGGVFRSRDGGETWRKTNSDRSLRQRAWYYSRIYADPVDEDSVYVVNVGFHRSGDGGRSFQRISTPHGDNHDLWIDPADPLRMIEANDGGANVSINGGKTWTDQKGQPTAQMYRVSTDNAYPYRLLGGQQDNSTVRIRSRSSRGRSIGENDWSSTAGGESGHVVAKPNDPEIVFGGSYGGYLTMRNHRTDESRAVNVWPDNPMGWGAAELKYRFNWNFPIFFSPHDPDLLYCAANTLFRTRDGGQSWETISPDLTRDDKNKQGPSGGPITKDNTCVEYYATIFAAVESHHEAGVLWCGSDDGLVHLSRDAGENWNQVTPPGMPEWMQINSIEVHPTVPGGLYVAGTRYKLDDFTPYLYRTLDYGASWERIDAGIPRDHFTRVVRADPGRAGLLYAGTERGVYVSFDDGGSWSSLQLDLPIVPVTDLAVKEGDLVCATQGRGYWILDDLGPIQQLQPNMLEGGSYLFRPRPAYRGSAGRSSNPGKAGTNPRPGVTLSYFLEDVPSADSDFRIDILDGQGAVVTSLTRKPGSDGKGGGPAPKHGLADTRLLTTNPGFNRVSWNLQYPRAETFPGMVTWNGTGTAPVAVPGSYTARLVVDGGAASRPFVVLPNPRSSATAEDYRAQFDFVVQVRDKLTEVHRSIRRLRSVRKDVQALQAKLGDEDAELAEAAEALLGTLSGAEKALYQTQNQSAQDPLNFPIRLNDKYAGLLGYAGRGDFAPTAQAWAVKAELDGLIDVQLAVLAGAFGEGVAAINRMASEANLPAISAD